MWVVYYRHPWEISPEDWTWAGEFGTKEEADRAAGRLRAVGYEVTVDWEV